MRIYTVHERAGAPVDGEGLVFVKEGFSWPAFLFPLLWLLFQRLWLVLVLYLGVAFAVASAAEAVGLAPAAALAVSLSVQFLLGCEANDLRRWTLARRGSREIAVACGRTLAEAERDFLHRWQGPAASEAPRPVAHRTAVWPRGEDNGPIGLFPRAGG
jgi:hypothetical protein